jgi:hypothetical protein
MKTILARRIAYYRRQKGAPGVWQHESNIGAACRRAKKAGLLMPGFFRVMMSGIFKHRSEKEHERS